jgi:Reverse transcriptase (RNA-dependent DNA polymerase)
LTAPYTP